MGEVVRLNSRRVSQTQIYITPTARVVNLIVDMDDQLDNIIRQLREEGHEYEAQMLAKAHASIRDELEFVVESCDVAAMCEEMR